MTFTVKLGQTDESKGALKGFSNLLKKQTRVIKANL